MLTKEQKLLCEVLLKKGVNLQKDQQLLIDISAAERDFAEYIVESAWRMGAGGVFLLWRDSSRLNNELMLQSAADGGMVGYDEGLISGIAESGGAYLKLDSPDYDGSAEPSDAEQISRLSARSRTVSMLFRQEPSCTTSLACIPNESWAARIFPDEDPEKRVSMLWEAVLACCRIKTPDPVKAWDDYLMNTAMRKELLNKKEYKKYHYTSGVTDLYLEPAVGEIWNGGCMVNSKGISFIPNIPTEEIFSCPHMYSANGYVRSTRPLYVMGNRIEDFRLEFKDGRVTSYKAEIGEDILKSIIEWDEGSSYLGEFALVDENSPISRTGLIFCNTLFDENASCHLALGLGGSPVLPEEKRRELGMNTSSQHIDFMVGSSDMLIRGLNKKGQWEDVFVNGSWSGEYSFA